MKYPQLVSSNAISAISDWLVYKLDELGVDAPIILVFSRFLLSLLANHADSLDVRREAVESLKQVSSSVDNKETKIAQLVDQLHSKLKKIEEETTLTASISFEPFSNRENFQQSQKEQAIVEEDPKKKYYMAFPALDKNGNADDFVSKTMPKSLNWSSIINIRSDKRHPIQSNKKLKSKRKRNFGRGKFENHKKNVNEPEPILWDMDFLGKGAWEMSADLYDDDFILKCNQINKNTLEAPTNYGQMNNSSKQNNLLEYNERCETDLVAAYAATMGMPRSGGRDAYYDCDDEDDEKRHTDRKHDTDPFEISDSFCELQNLKQLKSKFDSKVRALWDDQEDDNEFRFHDSENIIQNLAISLQLLQNTNNNCGASVPTRTCGQNLFYSDDHRPEQRTAHDFIKYGTNLNYSIWSDSVSVISANQSVWEQSGHDEKTLCNDATKPALEWPDHCVMEVLHAIDVVTTQPIYEHHGNSALLENTIEDSSVADVAAAAARTVQIPLVEVTLPNHSADSRFSGVVPSFFREAYSGQTRNPKANVPNKPAGTTNCFLPTHGSDVEANENLLTSEHTHFRPIKFPISPYIDGYSFRISNSPIKLEGVSRSETGSLYIDTKKYMEYKKTNADQNPDYSQKLHRTTNNSVEEFFIKFQVKQNEKFCQTESEYSVCAPENHAGVPKSHHDTDVGFWRMDNSELQQEPCINDPVNGLLKAETDLDGDEIMSDLSFIQNLYIGNDWNSFECVDARPVSETTNDYYDHNYECNIVYDLLKPETTKTLKKMLNQQVMLPNATTTAWTIQNDEPSNPTMADDYRFMEDKLNRYNNSISKQTATVNQNGYDNTVAESCGNGRRKRRYSECRKDKLHYYESVKVLPFVQDNVALENFITCKFWTTNFTIFNQNHNENDNYSEGLLIGLGNRPMTR